MNLETLEFIIYPDGRVQEMVTGIVGSSCQEVTALIEAQLGRVVTQEKTSDYYQKTQVSIDQSQQVSTWSDWSNS